jgi:polar amino acid transport system substrate-binding protein
MATATFVAVPDLRRLLVAVLAAALVALAACGDDDAGSGAATTPPSTAARAGQGVPGACSDLPTKQPGVLTVGTDKPAFPPYFEDDDPANGRGFESAVAYAVAGRLGYAKDEVAWKTVPFNSSYAPGPKDFDVDINQISITPQRAKRVDFSVPYFTAPQAVVAPEGSPAAEATRLADLAGRKLGVEVGTTSREAVQASIKPKSDPQVFNDSDDVTRALKDKRVDAVVVDLPTAFYLIGAEVEDAKIVGQFEAPGGDDWGLLLEKGSKLTPCVDRALQALRDDGELDAIEDRWLGGAAAPDLR